MKIPRAAKQLVREVQAVSADAEYEVTGEPDGFGVHREITFDPGTTKWLTDVLKVSEDPRISNLQVRSKAKKKRLAVCFVGSTLADFTGSFAISDILSVFDEPDEPSSDDLNSVGEGSDDAGDSSRGKRRSVDD